jgi:hypothetical protein
LDLAVVTLMPLVLEVAAKLLVCVGLVVEQMDVFVLKAVALAVAPVVQTAVAEVIAALEL